MINVYSAFDGIACARVALDRLGIPCNYYASEIDKYAVKIAKKNYPDIIELGDVLNDNLNILPEIDLFIGGSPCQDVSGAGKQAGIYGERSSLFFQFAYLLKELKPKYFVLENVASMKKGDRDIITETIGVEPVMIDAALVSAQSRKRLFWTNIQGIEQPTDKNILLKDILEDGVVDRDKSYCIDANYWKGSNNQPGHASSNHLTITTCIKTDRHGRIKANQNKAGCLSGGAHSGGNHSDMDILDFGAHKRRLTPVECERLQTLDDNYTEGISRTQRYKCLGNGFCVDVIKHILSYAEF